MQECIPRSGCCAKVVCAVACVVWGCQIGVCLGAQSELYPPIDAKPLGFVVNDAFPRRVWWAGGEPRATSAHAVSIQPATHAARLRDGV